MCIVDCLLTLIIAFGANIEILRFCSNRAVYQCSGHLSRIQVIWWLILFTIVLFGLIFSYNAVREKRGYVDSPAEKGTVYFIKAVASIAVVLLAVQLLLYIGV